ncbi:hypothetical protein AGMMS49957_15860 [Synergistales bacterium]|nr:hypothetical protein AGMMS49957_15860 [Synergistales bacterium]
MLAQTSPQMDKAVTIVKYLSADEQVRRDYEQAEKRRRDLMVITNTANREGLAKGEAMGIAKGEAIGIAKGIAKGALQEKLSVAKNLLAIGLPLDQIAKATGLTSSQIETL